VRCAAPCHRSRRARLSRGTPAPPPGQSPRRRPPRACAWRAPRAPAVSGISSRPPPSKPVAGARRSPGHPGRARVCPAAAAAMGRRPVFARLPVTVKLNVSPRLGARRVASGGGPLPCPLAAHLGRPTWAGSPNRPSPLTARDGPKRRAPGLTPSESDDSS
jgi:hypothetical protein